MSNRKKEQPAMQQPTTTTANGHDKAERFRHLAELRVTRAIKTLRQISNLSRRGNYDYTEEQVGKMFGAMRKELEDAERKFVPAESKQTALFKWD